jgi:prevent-host-death family protein
MATVGISELKQETSKILRRVREQREIIDITYHGKVVARLIPVTPPMPPDGKIVAVFTSLEALSAEISAQWPEGVSTPFTSKSVKSPKSS